MRRIRKVKRVKGTLSREKRMIVSKTQDMNYKINELSGDDDIYTTIIVFSDNRSKELAENPHQFWRCADVLLRRCPLGCDEASRWTFTPTAPGVLVNNETT